MPNETAPGLARRGQQSKVGGGAPPGATRRVVWHSRTITAGRVARAPDALRPRATRLRATAFTSVWGRAASCDWPRHMCCRRSAIRPQPLPGPNLPTPCRTPPAHSRRRRRSRTAARAMDGARATGRRTSPACCPANRARHRPDAPGGPWPDARCRPRVDANAAYPFWRVARRPTTPHMRYRLLGLGTYLRVLGFAGHATTAGPCR